MKEATQQRATNSAAAPVQSGARRYSVAQFLIVLVVMMVSAPFVEQLHDGKQIETGIISVVLLSAVMAIGGGRRTLGWGIALVIPALVGRWAHTLWSDRIFPEAGLVPSLLFVVFIVQHLLQFILRAPRVNSEVLCAGVATYLMLGLLWAFAYHLIERLVPNSFAFSAGPVTGQSIAGFPGLYFSCITLTTVGYGDIVPVSGVARMAVMMEALTGTLYMATLVARLVSIHSSTNQEKP